MSRDAWSDREWVEHAERVFAKDGAIGSHTYVALYRIVDIPDPNGSDVKVYFEDARSLINLAKLRVQEGLVTPRASGQGLRKRVTFDIEASYYKGGGQIVNEAGEARTLPPQVIIALDGYTVGVMKDGKTIEYSDNVERVYPCTLSDMFEVALEVARAVWLQHNPEPSEASS